MSHAELPFPQASEKAADRAPVGIISLDDAGAIVYANLTMHQMIGAPPQSLLGRRFDRLLTPASRVFYSTYFFPTLRLKGEVSEVWVQLRMDGGANLDMMLSAVLDLNTDRGITHCALMKIGQRHQLEVELIHAKKAAESAAAARDQFLTMISHELRAPLSAILGWAQIGLRKASDPATALKAFEIIERNAAAQAHLIDDLLDVSRIVSGKMRINMRRVDLNPLIAAASETVQPAARAKNIEISIEADPGPNLVLADPDRIQQIAWNLLSNAIKFTSKGGQVCVRTQHVNSNAVVSISDTGPGIAADQLPLIFDRFWQSETNAESKFGLGLGLEICRKLVELHGGTIRAQSPGLGEGATFTFELPISSTHSVHSDTLEY